MRSHIFRSSFLILFIFVSSLFAQGWFLQNPIPQTNSLASVHFIDQNTGWTVGQDGTILKTTNGGVSWISQSKPTSPSLYSVHFIDQNTGWSVGRAGIILKQLMEDQIGYFKQLGRVLVSHQSISKT